MFFEGFKPSKFLLWRIGDIMLVDVMVHVMKKWLKTFYQLLKELSLNTSKETYNKLPDFTPPINGLRGARLSARPLARRYEHKELV